MPLDQVDDEPGEMSFLDHLEELRWHLIRSLTAIFVFCNSRLRLKRCHFW